MTTWLSYYLHNNIVVKIMGNESNRNKNIRVYIKEGVYYVKRKSSGR
jgi:hypothetical protein